MHGDPLSMVLYGLGLLPLAEVIREADPGVIQPWYANNVSMWGTIRRNTKLLRALMEKGPFHGYFPELEKSWHICAEEREEEEAREAFDAKGVKVRFIRGQRYLGGFYRGREEMEAWLLSKIAKWAETI